VLTATQGEAIIHHTFLKYAPLISEPIRRTNGVLIASESGQVTAYAVENLHDRGVLFVEPGDQVYAGQVVGEHNRDNDLVVNITRLKQLTNVRSANKEQTVTLKAPRKMSMEECIEYIEDDELVEITPGPIRVRKRIMSEAERRKQERSQRDRATAGVE
jgi:GTP-binding protein